MALPPLPPLNFTGGAAGPSNAAGGYSSAAWEKGDLVVNYGDGANTTSGARSAAGDPPLGIGWGIWALCGAVLVGVMLWKRSH